MNVVLVSEDEALAGSIREIMMRERVYCPPSSVISFDQAVRRMAGVVADLIVAVLPEDPVRCIEALETLGTIPRSDRTLVVAIGPAADARLVIRALRGVVDDYLDLGDLEHELVTVLSGWRHRFSIDQPEGKLIAVLAPSGGSGSSMIAASLAVDVARDLKSVGLIDLKMETGDLATLLDLKPAYSLVELCKNLDRLDKDFFLQALIAHSSGIQLLASPKNLSEVDAVTPEGIRQMIGLAKTTFPFIVVDLDHRFSAEQVQILRLSELILIVFRLDFTSLKNTTKFLDHLDGLGIPANRIRLIANRQGQPGEVPLAKAEEALHAKLFHVLPDEPRTVNTANNNGVPVILDSPNSKIAKSLSKLTQAVVALTKPEKFVEVQPVKSESVPTNQPLPALTRFDQATDFRPNLAPRPAPSRVSYESRS